MTPDALPSSAAARWVLAVALVLGVLGMHALMGPPAGAGADGSAPMPAMVSMAPSDHAPSDHPAPADRGHAPAGGHSMLTTCLAVLGALTTLVLLAGLADRWAVPAVTALARRTSLLRTAGRPPPWTVPTLHQLSLLRV